MNQKQNIFSSPPKQNSTNFFTKNSNFPSNSILSNDKSKITLIPSIQRKKHNVVKKRTYNELMESYKEKQDNQYKREDEELYKKISIMNKPEYNFKKNLTNEKLILKSNVMKKNKFEKEKKKDIKVQKKFMIDDDIDDLENDFMLEKGKKKEKKFRLSKSYLSEGEPGFDSDLDDTKENSFSSLNFSFDYPEINLDYSLKDKLITNAIELEKTFHRFFNVTNMPNKNNGIILYSKMKEYKERFIWNKLINKLKEDFTEKISRNLNEMIIDSSDGEDINRNNEEMMPKYNSLYNENFLDDNDMILDD